MIEEIVKNISTVSVLKYDRKRQPDDHLSYFGLDEDQNQDNVDQNIDDNDGSGEA